MNYMLILVLIGYPVPPAQIGPFNSVFACEKAAEQARTLAHSVRTICVDLAARPWHWNGGPIPK